MDFHDRFDEWWDATYQLERLHASKPETKSDWTLANMFFANMGGFVLLYHLEDVNQTILKPSNNVQASTTSEVEKDVSTHERQGLLRAAVATQHQLPPDVISPRRNDTTANPSKKLTPRYPASSLNNSLANPSARLNATAGQHHQWT